MTTRIHSLPRRLFAFTGVLLLAACGNADFKDTPAANNASFARDDSFEVASAVDNNELSDMRGGFLFAGGLKIDFGLISITSINGIVKSSLSISSNNFKGVTLPPAMLQLLQNNNNNNNSNNSGTPPASNTQPQGGNNTNSNTPPTVQQLVQGNNNNPGSPPSNVQQLVLGSNSNNSNITPPAMQMIQSGNNNSIGVLSNPTLSNTFLTIFQNSANNAVIQNMNMISLTISNFSSFRSQAAVFNNQFSTVRALR
jgi:hypothetical protein